MLASPRAFSRVFVASVIAAFGIAVIPRTTAHSAPIGSPVSVTRNIAMSGNNLSNLVYDGTYVWVVGYGSSKVERINPSTGAIVGSPISVGSAPGGALLLNGHLFVAASGSNTVTDINTATATVTRTITLTGSAIAGLVYDGTYVWAISWSSSKAERFNPSTGALVGSALNVAPNPGGGVMANGHLFIPGSGGNTVTDIDTATATVTRTITLAGSNLAAAQYDGTNLWVTEFNNADVARINPTTGAVLGYSPVGSNPTNILYANGSIWVGATGTDTVTQLTTAGAVTRTIHLGGNNISNIVYDGQVIWTVNYGGAFVSQINASTGAVDPTTLSTGANPGALELVNNMVFVASTGSNTVTQISGPTPTTTTTTTTTTTSTTTTTTTVPSTVVTTSSTSTSSTVAAASTGSSSSSNSASTSSTAPAGQKTVSSISSIASTTSTSSTTSAPSTSTTIAVPQIPSVGGGTAAALVGDKSVDVQVTRQDNQIIVEAGALKATLSGSDDSGRISLDSDGNIRLLPGQTLNFTASGFTTDSSVNAWLFSTPTLLGTTMSDAEGSVTASYKIPMNTQAGSHRLAVVGLSTNGSLAKIAVGIKVGAMSKSHLTTWLITLPLSLAVLVAVFLPAVLKRRRRI